MPKYHIIVEDVQVYDFTIAIPDDLTPEEREDYIWNELAENREKYLKNGEELIVAMDEVQ